jgi:hypothetical protein
MRHFFIFIFALVKLIIAINIIYLLWVSWRDNTGVEFQKLTWWVYFMIFDIWLEKTVSSNEKNLD